MHQDHLTGTAVITDTDGEKVGSIKYYPYGETRESTGTLDTDKRFTGQRLDDTGLYYYSARLYDPTIGRFISPDTLVPSPANPQAFNRYSYCLNNPLRYTDPSGHQMFMPDYAEQVDGGRIWVNLGGEWLMYDPVDEIGSNIHPALANLYLDVYEFYSKPTWQRAIMNAQEGYKLEVDLDEKTRPWTYEFIVHATVHTEEYEYCWWHCQTWGCLKQPGWEHVGPSVVVNVPTHAPGFLDYQNKGELTSYPPEIRRKKEDVIDALETAFGHTDVRYTMYDESGNVVGQWGEADYQPSFGQMAKYASWQGAKFIAKRILRKLIFGF
ncbi:MAG TPA: RHS repeat-associated core domain-containing protein [Dehalococcoidia bacterium]|nr:RHS repeat-associated core domain-containing protein [Dehalococcoidia bacterium]